MFDSSHALRRRYFHSMIGMVAALAFFSGETSEPNKGVASADLARRPSGFPQLVAIEPMPVEEGLSCPWIPASGGLLLSLSQASPAQRMAARADEARTNSEDVNRDPVRVIRDTYPTYSAVALDLQTDEVYLQDENLFGYKVFGRLDNTPPNVAFTEPRRMVGGINTLLEFNCGLYVDPKSGDVYSVANDTVDRLAIFPREAKGNVAPKRVIHTPHGTFGIAVDEKSQEFYLTVQHDSAVVVYRKNAEPKEPPIRLLQGDRTRLADPHGIAVDTKNGWLFVNNHGSVHRAGGERGTLPANWPMGRDTEQVPGSGTFVPPSITVYSLTASGDAAPIRVIEGPKTQLNWPATMFLDEEREELYVANDAGDSVLVFRATDNGDVAPTRMIKGPKTGLRYPTGVFVDLKNNELWVSNMGNHSATVFPRTANGDVPPLRTIRSAPLGKQALAIGNPGAVAYDTKRDEILVPN